jgi:hypothetical protein
MSEASVSVQLEFPTCLHVSVSSARSERSAIMLARNFASRHYGARVGHYVSSGGSVSAGRITYIYVFSRPDAATRKRAERPRTR